MSRKIIGVTVGSSLPKPNFDQTDPRKGDYIRGDRSFITPDDTLTHVGRPADAKATGDAINQVQANIDGAVETLQHLNDTYYTEVEIDRMISDVNSAVDAKSDANHNHDDVYYTETEIDSKLGAIQSSVDSKVDKDGDKVLSSNDFTDGYKNKLDGIEPDANKYEHPTHPSHSLGLYKVTVDESGHVSGATLAEKDDIVALGIPEQDTTYDEEILDLSNRIDEVVDIVNSLDGTYYTEVEIDDMIADVNAAIDSMPDVNHEHNDLYYTKDEVVEAINTHADDIENPHGVTKAQIGLDKVDNTSDEDKPISYATAVALEGKSDVGHDHNDLYCTEEVIDDKLDVIRSDIDNKVNKDGDKVLSTNDYTDAEKEKLSTIEANANFYEHPTHTSRGFGFYKVAVDNNGHVSDAALVAKEDIVALGVPAQDTVYDDTSLKNRIGDVENSIVDINEALDDASRQFEGYKTTNDYAVAANTTNIEINRNSIQLIKDDYLTSAHEVQLQDGIKQVSDKVDENTKSIAVLNGEGEGSVKQSINNAFNEFATNVTNDDVVNTYIELINYAAKHGPEFTELVGVVDGIDTHVGKVETDFSEYKVEVSEQFEEVDSIINSHADNNENPHGVTKEQIGLANVDDTSDMDKPISNDMQEALDLKADLEHNHDDLYYDKEEILGLITVDDIDDICESNQGSDENIDLVNVATKYWVQAYYQQKGDYLTDGDINDHNASTSSHNDIRLLISDLATRLHVLADSDDDTLDQMHEVVDYIKNNKSLLEGVTTNKVNVSDITNNLTTNASNKPLSAAQGVVLKALIDAIVMPTKVSELENDSGYLKSYTETDPTVPDWAKAPKKPTYTASEVGAASTTHKHAISVTGANEPSTVTGSVTVPTVSKTQKYMTASATAPTLTNTTDSVLGANTEFIVSGGDAFTTKISATASAVAVGADGTANAITGFGMHTTANAITALDTTTIKNPTVTDVSIPNVTKNETVTASKVSATAGKAATWSASVTNGVLSFDWIANTPTAVTASDVTASNVTMGTALSASSVSTSNVTVATGSKSTAAAITALGTPTTAAALTGVKVTTQPTVTITSGSNGDVAVATGVSNISITASGDNVEVLTGVSVDAPKIALTNNSSNVDGSAPVVSAVDIGTVSASLQHGSAAAQKWTQSTGVTGTPQ